MTFHLLQSQASSVLLGLFEYFERQWMTSTAPALWNVHANDVWHTNNHCEGWHKRFNRAISKHHPNIWLCLDLLDYNSLIVVNEAEILSTTFNTAVTWSLL